MYRYLCTTSSFVSQGLAQRAPCNIGFSVWRPSKQARGGFKPTLNRLTFGPLWSINLELMPAQQASAPQKARHRIKIEGAWKDQSAQMTDDLPCALLAHHCRQLVECTYRYRSEVRMRISKCEPTTVFGLHNKEQEWR